jgi:carbon storage regulator
MLVLTRRIGESIMIGNEATFTVMRIQGDRIRVGIEAPRHVIVNRKEVQMRINAGNSSSALDPMERQGNIRWQTAKEDDPENPASCGEAEAPQVVEIE